MWDFWYDGSLHRAHNCISALANPSDKSLVSPAKRKRGPVLCTSRADRNPPTAQEYMSPLTTQRTLADALPCDVSGVRPQCLINPIKVRDPSPLYLVKIFYYRALNAQNVKMGSF